MTIEQELSALMQTLSEREADLLFEGRSVPSDTAAEDRIAASVMSKVKAETAASDEPVKPDEPVRQRSFLTMTRVLLAAAACLVIGVSVMLFQRSKPQTPPVSPETQTKTESSAEPGNNTQGGSESQPAQSDDSPAVTSVTAVTDAFAGITVTTLTSAVSEIQGTSADNAVTQTTAAQFISGTQTQPTSASTAAPVTSSLTTPTAPVVVTQPAHTDPPPVVTTVATQKQTDGTQPSQNGKGSGEEPSVDEPVEPTEGGEDGPADPIEEGCGGSPKTEGNCPDEPEETTTTTEPAPLY